MKWMVPEDKLGPDQKEVIAEIGRISDRPIWIKGHVGSGKSVVLLYALSEYMKLHPNAKVCVVVYTLALQDLIETGLKQIPLLKSTRIPVLTIYQMKYELNKTFDVKETDILVMTESLKIRLGDFAKPEFVNAIVNEILRDKRAPKYDAIFCDEVQDIPLSIIKSMQSFCKHLIIAGDEHQTIYNEVPIFESAPATAAEIIENLSPVVIKLSPIYRLTESVTKVLENVFPSMLKDKPNLSHLDAEILLYRSNSDNNEKEIKFCWQEIKQKSNFKSSDVTSVLLSTHDAIIDFVNKIIIIEGKESWQRVNNEYGEPNYDKLNEHLNNNNIPVMYIGNEYGSLKKGDEENKIFIMTYHSSKGLDFDYVFLPLVNDNMVIHPLADKNALLLVALSRSKSGLFITFTGKLYANLKNFLKGIEMKEIPINV